MGDYFTLIFDSLVYAYNIFLSYSLPIALFHHLLTLSECLLPAKLPFYFHIIFNDQLGLINVA